MTRALAALLLTWTACSSPPGDEPRCGPGDPVLQCAPAVSAACTGAVTTVAIDAPTVCGEGLAVSDSAPADGYPVGATDVTFTATGEGVSETCTTTVTITDATAPSIDCPDDDTVVRTDPAHVPSPPEAAASDDCSAAVTLTAEPAALANGVTEVTYGATDDAGNVATCTATFTVIDVFAVTGFRVLSATVNGAAETEVTLAWDRTDAADATGYRVERAADAAGPWTELATVAVDAVSYTDTLPASAAYYRVVTVADVIEGGATAPLRAFAIGTDLYDLRDVAVTGVPFATTLYGVVRHPSDLSQGPYPLILVLHGNHGNCRDAPDAENDYCATTNDHDCQGAYTTPNAEGYIYFLETLAAQGFVAVSLSGNAMNCRDDYILERSHLIIEHLRRWVAWNASADGPFGDAFLGAIDLSRVGLVGHSRGGDAVSNVPTTLESDPVPGAAIKSIFAIAPTDYHDVTVPGANLAVLLPACDGDVFDLIGMDHYDGSIPLDDGVRRAQVFFVGANHNFFNTEWKLSDNAGGFVCNASAEVGKQAQQAMLEATLGAWFRATLFDEPLEPFMRGEADTPRAMDLHAGTDLDLRWSYSSDERLLIDDFEGASTPALNALGLPNTFAGGWHDQTAQCFENGCDSRFDHKKGAMKLLWEQGNTPIATWQLAPLDASGYATLSFRVVSRRSSLNVDLEVQDFRVRVRDGADHVAELLLSDALELRHLYSSNFAREILQTARVRLDDLLALEPELDLTELQLLEFEMTALDRSGSVIVTDIELAR